MYIKIKNPERINLQNEILVLGILSSIILIAVVWLILAAGNMATAWEIVRYESADLFNYVKQEKDLTKIITVYGAILALFVLPLGLLYTIYKWFKNRNKWEKPDSIYALHFNPNAITVYTRQGQHFLSYDNTSFDVRAHLITVHTKGGSHAALNFLTFTFSQENVSFTVNHKPNSVLLYRLVDLHTRFKKFSFNCTLSSPYNTDQQALASFLKEQVKNQRIYGFHLRYKNRFIILFCSLLLVLFGIVSWWLPLAFVSFKILSSCWLLWPVLLEGLVFLSFGLWLFYQAIQDIRTVYKLKQLRMS